MATPPVLWSTFLNFGLLSEKLRPPSREAGRSIVSMVSRRVEVENVESGRSSRAPAKTSKRRSQVIYRPIRVGFEASVPGPCPCTLVQFPELWPTFPKLA
jgi:hypothetical protein